jgi:hypothetical protein
MSVEYDIGDYRFDGFSNQELAHMVDQLRSGPGSETTNRAVDALRNIANAIKQTDDTLRTELGKIGVEWTGDSSEDAQVVMTDSAQYGGAANGTITGSATSVGNQGSDFSRTCNSVPESGKLRGAEKYNVLDTLLCHTTDHSKEVQQTQAARQQAVDSMNGYASASRANLSGYQSLPVPPALNLQAQPIQHASTGTSVSSFSPGTEGPLVPGGPAGVPGGVPVGAPGGPAMTFDPITGAPITGGTPGIPGGTPGVPGTPGTPGTPGLPGKMTGTGPVPPLTPAGPPPNPLPPTFKPTLAGLDTAILGMAGGAGGGAAVGSVADKERLVRGPGRVSGVPEGSRGSSAIGASAGEEAAARTADRVGAKSRPGSSIMQPATGTAQGEEDDEHVRKYGIAAEDVFADDRMVIPSVLGEDDDE